MTASQPAVRASPTATVVILLLTDLAVVAGLCVVSWWLKTFDNPNLPATQYLAMAPALLLFPLAYAAGGLYPGIGVGAADALRRLTWATTLVFAGVAGATFLLRGAELYSRQVFLVAWALALFAVPLARWLVRYACCRLPWWGIPVAVLGAGRTGEQVVRLLHQRPALGLRPVAVLDDDAAKLGGAVGSLAVAGPLDQTVPHLPGRGIHHAILAMPGLPPERLGAVLDLLGGHLRHVYLAPALPGCPELVAETREFANTLVLEVRQNLLDPRARVAKRLLDLAGAIGGGLLILPLIAAIAALVRLSSPGPAFYGQRRIGRDGATFTAWKFRSMVADADAALARHLAAHPELREEWERDHKLKDDPRVTWIGALLRRTSLDELPQLWNVVRGEMSLVGPRPIVAAEVAKYGARYALYTKVRPGMSGLWQVSGRNDTTYAERVALDCYYVRNWSPWLDLVILAHTVRVVALSRGAY
jgi:Undecaprenyl-phosphate galactose phosphotransferase WbaP